MTNFPSIFEILPFILIYSTLCQGQLNLTEYKRMPALSKLDNYDDCIYRAEAEPKYPAKFCMVLVQIQPNNNSSEWRLIESMMSDKYHYRHDYVFRGVCMENCKDLLEINETNSNFENEMLTIEQTQMFERFYNTKLDRIMRYDYQKDIHECVNREYVKNYNLSTKTFTSYCIDPQQSREKDIYFGLTIFLIVILILINILSSIYDAKLKSQQLKSDDTNNYYEVKHTDKVNRYLTAFSVYRNYKRLVMPNTGDIGSDLRFLDGFRSILCHLIVIEHGFLLAGFYVENTEFVESLWQILGLRLFAHALIWLELFFILSGLLMYIKFEKSQYITPNSSFLDCVNVFVRLLFSRYLRYLPSMLLVILFTANINYYYGNFSLARGVIDAICSECRYSWWQNILMINNYYMKSSCLMHTWYIAADFHLYGLFLIIVIIMAKYPKLKTFILISVATIAAVINFGVNYILKLNSTFMFSPESFRYTYFKDIETAEHMYFSSYTNINSFLLGIVCGLIYMKYLRKNPENKKKLGEILLKYSYIGWIAIAGILYLGATIMGHKETTIWTAAYGLLHRHVGLAIVVVIVILRGMCNGGGFLKSDNFRFLARISFQVYLWQISVFINFFSHFNQPFYLSTVFWFMFSLFVYVCTNLIAFLVAVFVEYPIAEVIGIVDIEKKIKQIKTT